MNFGKEGITLDFSEALEKVKEGYSVTRKAWNCVYKIKLVAMPTQANSVEGEGDFHATIVKLNGIFGLEEMPYTPTEKDLMMRDWIVCMTDEEKEILQINKIVESAIYHGGDSEGPYYSGFDSLCESILGFIKLTKRNGYYAIIKNDGEIPKVMQVLFKSFTDSNKDIDNQINKQIDEIIEEDNK